MNTTTESIKAFVAGLPVGTKVSAKKLLHLGERAAVDQALSRFVGHAFRAMAYYGKSEADQVLRRLKLQLNEEEQRELFALRAGAPTRLAQELSALANA